MKAIDEFKISDETECLHRAVLMACATVNSVWQDNKDEEGLSEDDLHTVKTCVQIMCQAKELNKTIIP